MIDLDELERCRRIAFDSRKLGSRVGESAEDVVFLVAINNALPALMAELQAYRLLKSVGIASATRDACGEPTTIDIYPSVKCLDMIHSR
jgi:hypothetical protein